MQWHSTYIALDTAATAALYVTYIAAIQPRLQSKPVLVIILIIIITNIILFQARKDFGL